MTVQDVWEWLNRFAPFDGQEDFDNAGLLLGSPGAHVHRVLFALDATAEVIAEASGWNADLIVTHHPLLFGGIRAIRYDQPEGHVLALLAEKRFNLIAVHTNFDLAAGGTGDALAAALRLTDVRSVTENPYLRIGRLPCAQTAQMLLQTVDSSLSAHTRMYGDPARRIESVTVGAGALGEACEHASDHGAQAFVVGEIKHHQILAAQALGLVVYEAGHYETELPGMQSLTKRFQSAALEGHCPVEARLTTIQPYVCATSDDQRKKGS